MVVDKAIGMTSFDVIRRLRRILGMRALGHTGTLDPAASGVLCVCAGWSLKLLRFLPDDHKVYRATMRLGVTTDTDDADGAPLEERAVNVTESQVVSAVASFVGSIEQVPPLFSAIKVKGERAYSKARRGEQVELAARKVRIDSIGEIEIGLPEVRFTVCCGKGTYIRSLARDIGDVLGTGAHLTALRRLESGSAGIQEALTLEQIEQVLSSGQPLPVRSCWEMLSALPAIHLDATAAAKLRNGQPIGLPALAAEPEGALFRVGEEGTAADRLISVAEIRKGLLKPVKTRPN